MKRFFRAFTLTLIFTLVPFFTLAAILYADGVTRQVGYDDLSPAAAITDSQITIFGDSYDLPEKSEKINRAKSFLTPPEIKLEISAIQTIIELIGQLSDSGH